MAKPLPVPQCLFMGEYQCPIPCVVGKNCNYNCVLPPNFEKITKPVQSTFDLFSLVFGFDFPQNYKLCPVVKCEPKTCLCRENVHKLLTAFLLHDENGPHKDFEDSFEKEEL